MIGKVIKGKFPKWREAKEDDSIAQTLNLARDKIAKARKSGDFEACKEWQEAYEDIERLVREVVRYENNTAQRR